MWRWHSVSCQHHCIASWQCLPATSSWNRHRLFVLAHSRQTPHDVARSKSQTPYLETGQQQTKMRKWFPLLKKLKAFAAARGTNFHAKGLWVPCWIHQGSAELAAGIARCGKSCWCLSKTKQTWWESCSSQLHFRSATPFLDKWSFSIKRFGSDLSWVMKSVWNQIWVVLRRGMAWFYTMRHGIAFARYAFEPAGTSNTTLAEKVSTA